MKREEKNQITRCRIMDSALNEFSLRGYGASSINTICATENISKGIIYHYFETKDELFLSCVKECFDCLADYIRENLSSSDISLEDYFSSRMKFFRSNPVYQRIFIEAVVSPPHHLRERIGECRKDFDDLNKSIINRLLEPYVFRSSISKEEISESFRLFQDFINICYQLSNITAEDFEERERMCRKTLDILLYGVIERK